MGQHTDIQWCDSSVNCTAGCCGCELWGSTRKSCYAGVIHTRFSPSKSYPGPFEETSLHPGRMAAAAKWSDLRGKVRPDKPWLGLMPRIVFVSDMSDALSPDVPFEYLNDEIVMNVTSEFGQRHIWMWLTKVPHRMVEFAQWLHVRDIVWPKNLWAGTSVTSQKTVGRIRHLLKVPAAIRFVSVEPIWEPVHLRPFGGQEVDDLISPIPYRFGTEHFDGRSGYSDTPTKIDLVIAGGESGPNAKSCDLRWFRSLRDQCRAVGTSYFLKQWGAKPYDSFYTNGGQSIHLKDSHGGNWNQWCDAALKVREFPAAT